MMKHAVIVGYGYVGYYLACALLSEGYRVTAFSRTQSIQYPKHANFVHHCSDITEGLDLSVPVDLLCYAVPPPGGAAQDSYLSAFLGHTSALMHRIIYFSSTGVYGQQQGEWVNEATVIHPVSLTQQARLNAEQQWLDYCHKNCRPLVILRLAGIYGPGRIPLEKAHTQAPLIRLNEAPVVNMICVHDLSRFAIELSQCIDGQEIFNLADGQPQLWGSSQRMLAKQLSLPTAPEISFSDYYAQASPMLQQFLTAEKRVCVDKVRSVLGMHFSPYTLEEGLIWSLGNAV